MVLEFMVTQEAQKAKAKMIRAEKKKLNTLLSELEDNRKKVAEGLIDECAFMRATLKQLREYIDINGCIDEMSQGEYSILRESPAVRTYNTMVQKYSAVCKQLFDLLPSKAQPPIVDDGFDTLRAVKQK